MKTFKQFIEESAKKKLILKGYQTLKSVIKKPKVKSKSIVPQLPAKDAVPVDKIPAKKIQKSGVLQIRPEEGSFYSARDTVKKGYMVNTQNKTYTPIDPTSNYGQNYLGQQNTAGDMKLKFDPTKGKPPKKRLTFKKPFDPNK